ncbi:MAG: hypothetical protein JXL81_04165 [Deltaproteobacteria bacterium]|nr:hypothetical protein [Deltaproteobacteria bacterium]
MKKILFIMILATTFIPVPQTGASIDETDILNKVKANEVQTVVKHVSDNVLDNDVQLISSEIKRDKRVNKNNIKKQRLVKKSISIEKRDRLFGLLLLAHGGQR